MAPRPAAQTWLSGPVSCWLVVRVPAPLCQRGDAQFAGGLFRNSGTPMKWEEWSNTCGLWPVGRVRARRERSRMGAKLDAETRRAAAVQTRPDVTQVTLDLLPSQCHVPGVWRMTLSTGTGCVHAKQLRMSQLRANRRWHPPPSRRSTQQPARSCRPSSQPAAARSSQTLLCICS